MSRLSQGVLLDLLLASLLAAVAVALERTTQGRVATESILLWVGVGFFAALRIGAVLARAGRTLGCGYVFLLTWVLPCVLLLYLIASSDMQRVVRDSVPLFVLLGLYLIVVMVVTFERLRLADERRAALGRVPLAQTPSFPQHKGGGAGKEGE